GWEQVEVPSDFSVRHQLAFRFPLSHGLVAAIGWSIVSLALAPLAMKCAKRDRLRAALLIGLAVFSHWLLDAIVHRPELPIVGESSAKVGFSLWDHRAFALAVESLLGLFGLWFYLRSAGLPRWRKIAAG